MAKMKFALTKTYVLDGYSFGPCPEIELEPRFGNQLIALGVNPISVVIPTPAPAPGTSPKTDTATDAVSGDPDAKDDDSDDDDDGPSMSMSKAELVALAKDQGLDVQGMSKGEIIEALNAK